MSILNPKRILTRQGRSELLLSLFASEEDGLLVGLLGYAVTDVTVSPDGMTISGAVAAIDGAGTQKDIEFNPPVTLSSSGKLFILSSMTSFNVTTSTGPQVVKGVLLTKTDLDTDVIGYVEFDDHRTLDENGEAILFSLEVGFDNGEFYIMPRLLDGGA